MIAAHDALIVAAAVLLPGTAFIAGRVAFTTWRQQRRTVRIIDNVRSAR